MKLFLSSFLLCSSRGLSLLLIITLVAHQDTAAKAACVRACVRACAPVFVCVAGGGVEYFLLSCQSSNATTEWYLSQLSMQYKEMHFTCPSAASQKHNVFYEIQRSREISLASDCSSNLGHETVRKASGAV